MWHGGFYGPPGPITPDGSSPSSHFASAMPRCCKHQWCSSLSLKASRKESLLLVRTPLLLLSFLPFLTVVVHGCGQPRLGYQLADAGHHYPPYVGLLESGKAIEGRHCPQEYLLGCPNAVEDRTGVAARDHKRVPFPTGHTRPSGEKVGKEVHFVDSGVVLRVEPHIECVWPSLNDMVTQAELGQTPKT